MSKAWMAGNQHPRKKVGVGARHRQVVEEDTDDSGIETMMTASVAHSVRHAHAEHLDYLKLASVQDPLISSKRRSIRVDDILWLICFVLTVLFFDIPNTLLFNPKVNWFYLECALANQLTFCCLAIYFRIFYHFCSYWALTHSNYVRVAMTFCSFFTALSFCLATWQVYEVWSIYICLVSAMSFLACIAVI